MCNIESAVTTKHADGQMLLVVACEDGREIDKSTVTHSTFLRYRSRCGFVLWFSLLSAPLNLCSIKKSLDLLTDHQSIHGSLDGAQNMIDTFAATSSDGNAHHIYRQIRILKHKQRASIADNTDWSLVSDLCKINGVITMGK